ncbi:ATP-grasp domain-containing protein [Candidatus Woesearchaeota archaeon]|nr:ATP-grasp domain-containing protein [Candidatus Woesearchaeota archaeon]
MSILVLCPTEEDLKELPGRGDFLYYGPDILRPGNFDIMQFLQEVRHVVKQNTIDGIIATDDYPASSIGAVLCKEFGFPGARPDVHLLCQHKYYSRIAQQHIVPEATPSFALCSAEPPLPYPFFVKPVKSYFSIGARLVASREEYRAACHYQSTFSNPFNTLLRQYTPFTIDGHRLLAEEVLRGQQVTVEGYVQGKPTITGIIDSIMYPGTFCFKRFDCPSSLPQQVQKQMASIAGRVMTSLGFDNSCFNIEMMYDPMTERLSIIEINPRMSAQFADLVEKVSGTNTYDVQLALTQGRKPVLSSQGPYGCASSYVLRVFRDMRVLRAPTPSEIISLEQDYDARLYWYGRQGALLSEELQDGVSYRYGLINIGGKNASDRDARSALCKRELERYFVLADA